MVVRCGQLSRSSETFQGFGASTASQLRLNSAEGFITEDEANRVTIFDLRTLKKTATAKTGNSPDGIIYDSSSKRVFVFSGDGKVTAVNAATGAVAWEAIAALGGSPEFAASDGRGHIYNNLEDKNEVARSIPGPFKS